MNGVPWFWPGVVVAVIAAIALSGSVAGWLGVRRAVGWSLVVATGMILAATLTPLRAALETGAVSTMTCDFTRMGRASLGEMLRIDDTSLNVLLFVPLGLVVGLLPRSRRKAAIAAGAVALPFVVETVQLLGVVLDRACQSADIFDNLSGLLVGLVLGTVVGRLAPWLVVHGRTE